MRDMMMNMGVFLETSCQLVKRRGHFPRGSFSRFKQSYYQREKSSGETKIEQTTFLRGQFTIFCVLSSTFLATNQFPLFLAR